MISSKKITKRGYLEMTRKTSGELKNYMHTMKQFKDKTLYYGALPVLKTNARRNAFVSPSGERIQICL